MSERLKFKLRQVSIRPHSDTELAAEGQIWARYTAEPLNEAARKLCALKGGSPKVSAICHEQILNECEPLIRRDVINRVAELIEEATDDDYVIA